MTRYEGRSYQQGTMLQRLQAVQEANRRPATVTIAVTISILMWSLNLILGWVLVFDPQGVVDWLLAQPAALQAMPVTDPEVERLMLLVLPWAGVSMFLQGLFGVWLSLRVFNRRRLAWNWMCFFLAYTVVVSVPAVLTTALALPVFVLALLMLILLRTGPGRAWFKTAPRVRR